MNYWVHQIGILCGFWGAMFIPVGFAVGFTTEYIQFALSVSLIGTFILFFITGEFEPLFKRIRQNYKNAKHN